MKIQRAVLVDTVAMDKYVLRLIAHTILRQSNINEVAIDFIGGGKHQKVVGRAGCAAPRSG
jgi:microcompartment protein CcmK/EutM